MWIDDRYAGKQDSFACAHSYDLTGYLTKAKHRLAVMVSNVDYATPGGHMTSPDTQTNWNGILGKYKARDARHWYVQGSNNFQWFPEVLPHDDFFCGVRFTKERRFRGSYAMCDAPQGHVQVTEPENCYSYDPVICPQTAADAGNGTEEVEIQYQTGVRASGGRML